MPTASVLICAKLTFILLLFFSHKEPYVEFKGNLRNCTVADTKLETDQLTDGLVSSPHKTFCSESVIIYILPPIHSSARERLSNAGLLHPSM